MAALTRPTEATYVIHEKVTVDTTDREDHTFSGIMFPIKCKDILPVAQIVINSIAVRGELGPVTVWVTNDDVNTFSESTTSTARRQSKEPRRTSRGNTLRNLASVLSKRASSAVSTSVKQSRTGKISLKPQHWTKIYSQTHSPSYRAYTSLDISSNPIVLKPSQVRGIYIHSTLDGDEAIVYDNRQQDKTHDDNFITVLPGRAHVSSEPFGSVPLWGYGSAWRDNREFVGKISYGVVYRLWNPNEHKNFAGNKFQNVVRTMFACQRRRDSPLSRLPDDVIFYIMNMCRWDCFGDGYGDFSEYKKKCRKVAILLDGTRGEAVTRADAARAASGSITCGGDTCSDGQCKQNTAGRSDGVNEMEDDGGSDGDGEGEGDDDDDDDDSDMDTTYDHGDHTSSNTFYFTNADDCTSSDEDNAPAERRAREEGQRRMWTRHNHRFLFQLGGLRAQFLTNSDGDCDDNDSEEA